MVFPPILDFVLAFFPKTAPETGILRAAAADRFEAPDLIPSRPTGAG